MGIPAIRPAHAVSIKRKFKAAREKVFRAWTQPEALRRWWCPAGWQPGRIELDLRTGGEYRIEMRMNGGRAVRVRGTFLRVDAPEKLVYTWRWEGIWEWMPETKVTVEFRSVEGGTELSLVHEEFDSGVMFAECRNLWRAACGRLEREV